MNQWQSSFKNFRVQHKGMIDFTTENSSNDPKQLPIRTHRSILKLKGLIFVLQHHCIMIFVAVTYTLFFQVKYALVLSSQGAETGTYICVLSSQGAETVTYLCQGRS